MKKVSSIIGLFLIFVISFGCQFNSSADKTGSATVDDSNTGISGPVVKVGDSLYESDGRVYKVNLNDTKRTYIENAYGSIIAVVDDWVYYVSNIMGMPGSNGIFKVKDGKNIQLTNDDYILEAVYYKGSIYYALGPSSNGVTTKSGLFKVDIDGKHRTEITDQFTCQINISDDWIYYRGETDVTDGGVESSEDLGIYKIRIDGTSKTKIFDGATKFLTVSNNKVYFSNSKDGGKLYKISTDGKNEKKLSDDNSGEIKVYDNWVYYAIDPYEGHTNNSGDFSGPQGNIYKVTTDGDKRTKLCDKSCRIMAIVDGWIYYGTWNDGHYYKMRIDGSDKTVLDNLPF